MGAMLHGPERSEADRSLLMPDGRDVRTVNRAERRAAGFRGPVYTLPAPGLGRYARRHRHQIVASGRPTRRQRGVLARTMRFVARRGLS